MQGYLQKWCDIVQDIEKDLILYSLNILVSTS